ncbi:MAG: hypothetical protein ACQERJ_01730 [Bacillota bacterium]
MDTKYNCSIWNKIFKPYHKLMLKLNKKNKVFVLGNPYSKASWVAKILSEKSENDKVLSIPAGYSNSFYLESEKKSLNSFIEDYPFYFTPKIISETMFTFFYDQLLKSFPEGEFLFVIRNPVDNIIDILQNLDLNPSETNYEISEIKNLNLNSKWKKTLNGKFIGEHKKSRFIHINLAYQWLYSYRIIKFHAENSMFIRYEDLSNNNIVDNLCEELGLSQEKKVKLGRNSNNNSIDSKFSGIKKEIIEICKIEMRDLNYL